MEKIFRKLDYGNGVKYWFMFNRPIAKKNGNCFYLLKPSKGDHWDADDWYTGWHSWTFDISYEACGYETANGELNISILGWHRPDDIVMVSDKSPVRVIVMADTTLLAAVAVIVSVVDVTVITFTRGAFVIVSVSLELLPVTLISSFL